MTTLAAVPSPSRTLAVRLAELGRRLPDLFVNAVVQRRVLSKPYAGIMHLLIFWGVSIQIVGTIINILNMQLFFPWVLTVFPRGRAYLGYEVVMDLAGVAILLGVGMALARRLFFRPKALEQHWDDVYALVLLACIPIAGFTLEATRLVANPPAWAAWSPAGNIVAGWLRTLGVTPEAATGWHTPLFWTHATLGLALLVSIPFTKLRHLVDAPLHILARPRRNPSGLDTIRDIENAETLGVGAVREFTPTQLLSFDACLRCGRCEEVCPSTAAGEAYSPRDVIQSLRRSMVTNLVEGEGTADDLVLGTTLAEDNPWHCTTCGACIEACPVFINPVDAVVDLRRYQAMSTGKVPKAVADVLRNMERQSNPWGMPMEDRADRVKALGIRTLAPGESTDTLIFLGCAASYDDRNGKSAKAFVELLTKAGVDFATLGDAEMCCGESARRLGHEYLFQELAKANIEQLQSVAFRRIVTQCAHCFNTLRNEYPELGGRFEVLHFTEYLATLKMPSPATSSAGATRVAYHDSCYLGRYNDIYSAPRALLDGLGGPRVELARHGADSFCCGGGGGLMWQETDPDKRINQRRLDDVIASGADVVATACPYCLLMFDDAIRTKGLGDRIRVMDIAEILNG
jgi:Fe-S oxidoreductase/nitrate reductase gamma subunit